MLSLQCLAAAVLMVTRPLRAILLDQGASVPAQEPSAPLLGSRRVKGLKARAKVKPKEMSMPATGEGHPPPPRGY